MQRVTTIPTSVEVAIDTGARAHEATPVGSAVAPL